MKGKEIIENIIKTDKIACKLSLYYYLCFTPMAEHEDLRKKEHPNKKYFKKGQVIVPDEGVEFLRNSNRVKTFDFAFYFDPTQIIVDITEKMQGTGKPYRTVAKESGVPESQLSQVLFHGHFNYKMETFCRLCSWLGNHPSRYFRRETIQKTFNFKKEYEQRMASRYFEWQNAGRKRFSERLEVKKHHKLRQGKGDSPLEHGDA